MVLIAFLGTVIYLFGSDTTILASSATGTDLFVHIRYMMYTTINVKSRNIRVRRLCSSFLHLYIGRGGRGGVMGASD